MRLLMFMYWSGGGDGEMDGGLKAAMAVVM